MTVGQPQIKRKDLIRPPASTTGFLKAVSHPTRLSILAILRAGDKCVCEINQTLDLPQNLISHHLKVLAKRQLIKAEKRGVKIFYRLNRNRTESELSLLRTILS